MINGKKTFPTVWSFLRPVDLWGTIFLILQTCFCTMFSETFRDHLFRLKLCREYAISTIFLHSSWELNISCLCKITHYLHTVREEFKFHNMPHCIPKNLRVHLYRVSDLTAAPLNSLREAKRHKKISFCLDFMVLKVFGFW